MINNDDRRQLDKYHVDEIIEYLMDEFPPELVLGKVTIAAIRRDQRDSEDD